MAWQTIEQCILRFRLVEPSARLSFDVFGVLEDEECWLNCILSPSQTLQFLFIGKFTATSNYLGRIAKFNSSMICARMGKFFSLIEIWFWSLGSRLKFSSKWYTSVFTSITAKRVPMDETTCSQIKTQNSLLSDRFGLTTKNTLNAIKWTEWFVAYSPMQYRGPMPNGLYVPGMILCLFSSLNRSGSNLSGSSKYFGSFCMP